MITLLYGVILMNLGIVLMHLVFFLDNTTPIIGDLDDQCVLPPLVWLCGLTLVDSSV